MAQPDEVDHGWMHGMIFTLKKPKSFQDDDDKYTLIPAGTKVKVVMVSRFGDCGITRNLNANGNSCMGQGYETRVQPNMLVEIE